MSFKEWVDNLYESCVDLYDLDEEELVELYEIYEEEK